MSEESAADLLQRIQGHQAWAVIRRKAEPTVGLVGGSRSVVDSLLDIPLETGAPTPGRSADRLVAVPFRQVAERGFEAIDDQTPLVVVDVESEEEFSVAEIIDAIDAVPVEFADRGGFDLDDDDRVQQRGFAHDGFPLTGIAGAGAHQQTTAADVRQCSLPAPNRIGPDHQHGAGGARA